MGVGTSECRPVEVLVEGEEALQVAALGVQRGLRAPRGLGQEGHGGQCCEALGGLLQTPHNLMGWILCAAKQRRLSIHRSRLSLDFPHSFFKSTGVYSAHKGGYATDTVYHSPCRHARPLRHGRETRRAACRCGPPRAVVPRCDTGRAHGGRGGWCRLVLSSQLFQQRLSFLKVSRVKALGEPTVNRSQESVGVGPSALPLPQPTQAHGGPQL